MHMKDVFFSELISPDNCNVSISFEIRLVVQGIAWYTVILLGFLTVVGKEDFRCWNFPTWCDGNKKIDEWIRSCSLIIHSKIACLSNVSTCSGRRFWTRFRSSDHEKSAYLRNDFLFPSSRRSESSVFPRTFASTLAIFAILLWTRSVAFFFTSEILFQKSRCPVRPKSSNT